MSIAGCLAAEQPYNPDKLSVEQLERVSQTLTGRIRELAGFGAKTEQRILEGLALHAEQAQRWPRAAEHELTENIIGAASMVSIVCIMKNAT